MRKNNPIVRRKEFTFKVGKVVDRMKLGLK